MSMYVQELMKAYPHIRPATAFTPAYLWEEFSPLLEPKKTSYGQMNDWMRMARDTERAGGVPLTVTDSNWREMQKSSDSGRNGDFNKKYDRAYNDLTSKIAYRYPNPGLARQRQGRIGGTWRHIKEVLGHGGSRVVYVDGLISVYDKECFNKSLSDESPYRPHLRLPQFSRSKTDLQLPPVSNDKAKLAFSDADVARKMSLNSSSKHKGFYRSK